MADEKNASTPVSTHRVLSTFKAFMVLSLIALSSALIYLSFPFTLNEGAWRSSSYSMLPETTDEIQRKFEQFWIETLDEASVQLHSHQDAKPSKNLNLVPRQKNRKRDLFSRGFLDGLLGGGNSASTGASQSGGGILGGLLGGGRKGANTTAGAGGILGGLLGGGTGSDGGGGGLEGVLTSVVSNLISQAVQGQGPLGSIVSGLADAAGPAANALGSGLGMGTVKGLKLQTMMNSPMSQPEAKGISGLAMNLGEGLSSSIFSNLNTSTITTPATINKAAGLLGSGLGNGTASVIGAKKTGTIVPSNDTGIPGAAGNLGLGLSTGLFGNIDFSKLQSSNLMAQLSKIPGPAGRGLGEGAAQALKTQNGQKLSLLPRATTIDSSNSTTGASGFDVAQASEDFTRSLSSSFLEGMNTSAFMSSEAQKSILSTVSEAAGPAGKGLGSGGAAGLAKLMRQMGGDTMDPGAQLINAPPTSVGTNKSARSTNSEMLIVSRLDGARSASRLHPRQVMPATSNPATAPGSVGLITTDFTMNLAENFVGNLDVSGIMGPKVQEQFMTALASAAPGAGRGLGAGAAQGLGLSQATGPFMVPSKDASGIAEGFTHELSSSFLSDARSNVQKTFNTTQLLAMVASAAPAAGRGLGSGSARGLGLSNATSPSITPGSLDTSAIAEGFTDALSSSFITDAKINLNQGINQTQIMSLLATAAPRAGKGLGSGAAQGLGLSNSTSIVLDRNHMDTGDITEGFIHELSSSFTSNANIADLAKKAIDTNVGSTNMLANTAEGLGKGIGGGTAIGLGLQPDTSEPVADASASSIAQTFGRGLTSSFLANGTLGKLESSASQAVSSIVAGVNFSKAAEGLGVGLVDGVSGALSPGTNTNDSSTSPTSDPFNDSVGGAAVGLGKGVGSQSVKVLALLFSNNSTTSMSQNSKRSALDSPLRLLSASATGNGGLTVRQALNITILPPQKAQSEAPLSSILDNLDYNRVSDLLQKSIDTLGCQGFGGLLQAVKALQASGTIPDSTGGGGGGSGSQLALLPLPDKTLNVTSDGNMFQIKLSGIMDNNALIINGIPLNQLFVLISVHIAFVIFSAYIFLPTSIVLEATKSLAHLTDNDKRFSFEPRAQLALQILTPLFVVVGAGTGAAAVGTATHFRTPHQITGWILSLFLILSPILYYLRRRSPTSRLISLSYSLIRFSILILALLELFLGFQDLNSISLCTVLPGISPALLVVVGSSLTAIMFTAVGVLRLNWLVGRWVRKEEKEAVVEIQRDQHEMVISGPMPGDPNEVLGGEKI